MKRKLKVIFRGFARIPARGFANKITGLSLLRRVIVLTVCAAVLAGGLAAMFAARSTRAEGDIGANSDLVINARVSTDGGGTWAEIDNGVDEPVEVRPGDRVEYEISGYAAEPPFPPCVTDERDLCSVAHHDLGNGDFMACSNIHVIDMVRDSTVRVTDYLPDGFTYLTHTDSTGDAVFNRTGQKTSFAWDTAPGEPFTLTITVEVDEARLLYVNHAWMNIGSDPAIYSNVTRHKYVPVPAVKNAQVKRGGTGEWEPIDNGDEADPVQVAPGDHIKYDITADHAHKGSLLRLEDIRNFVPQTTDELYTNSYLLLDKTAKNLTTNVNMGPVDAGDTVEYKIQVTGYGESDASEVEITDTLPVGMDFVLGSVKAAGESVSATYDGATRELTIPVGLVAGSGSTSDDCDNVVDVTFEVTVNGLYIAEDLKYMNQAKAAYCDRGYEFEMENGEPTDNPAEPYESYSNVCEVDLQRRNPAGTVTDDLPEGLAHLSPSVHTDAGGAYSYDGTEHEITWSWPVFPAGKTTVSVTMEVADAYWRYMNRAFINIDGWPAAPTNKTWHGFTPEPPRKRSFVSTDEGGAWGAVDDNFEEEDAVNVLIGDQIKYNITLDRLPLAAVPNPEFQPYTNSCIDMAKTNNAPVGGADAGSVVTYTLTIKNTCESDASNVVISDLLPTGTDLVPGSVKVDGVTKAYGYNTAARELTVDVGTIVGDGSSSVDYNNEYTLTFDVKVDGILIAKNRKYENQAKATYQDRYDEENTVYTDYSNVSVFLPGRGLYDTVTDKVPNGLDVDLSSISHSGTYDPVTRIITWDLAGLPAGGLTLEFVAAVTKAGAYTNKAYVGETPTNETWHQMLQLNLHIRQIVIDPLSGVQRPTMGYYTLTQDDGSIRPLTSNSLVLPEFTDYTLLPGDDPVYVLTDIVPQYYKFVGHGQNPGEDPDPAYHSLTAAYDTVTANGGIELDYNDAGEIWITVYITPEGKPGHNQATVETNRFGDVYKVYYNVTYYPGYDGIGGSIDMDILRGSTYTIKSAVIANVNKPWSSFASWNTQIDGSGTKYMPGQEIKLSANLELYAQWLVVAT